MMMPRVPESANEEPSQSGGAQPGTAKLLLVDDDRLILATLSEGLRQAGYVVVACASAAEALELAAKEPFDLAILDVRIPGMDGLELARRLHEYTPVPFLFLSAYADLALVRQGVQHGALGYLIKPLDVPQIIPSVEAALARAREIRRLKEVENQLSTALNIEQKTRMAVGLLMERRRLDRKAAFDLLRSIARSQRRKIADVSDELLAATEKVNEFAPQRSQD